jgi:hypothetical protein
LRLWTIQHPAVWEVLRERGVYRVDGRRVWKEFRPAYRWLIVQMKERLPGYSGRYPIWAWHTPKPDMREVGHYPPGKPCARLTLEIPDEEAPSRVLLSGFDAWGWHVLNNWYLYLSDEEYEWWDRLAPERFREGLSPHLQEMVHRSWERIFDLELLDRAAREDEEACSPLHVQATFLSNLHHVTHTKRLSIRALAASVISVNAV